MVIFQLRSLIQTNLLGKFGFKLEFFLQGFTGCVTKDTFHYVILHFDIDENRCAKLGEVKCFCVASPTHNTIMGKRELVRKRRCHKDFSTTALSLEQSNADIRHTNSFHCESGVLVKSGKI